ncbi:hypothetical protein [Deinococcus soli (ex Cha et al. 2016)]|uniref:hypothetical protein n=1 Tax=Deinococcus soli (ex Cha et al. 2016) TaxID=1309411 RepID=UPI001663E3DB|nr:hypothetical protein [Deinococcus soli (ex Cha et al. 2016)]
MTDRLETRRVQDELQAHLPHGVLVDVQDEGAAWVVSLRSHDPVTFAPLTRACRVATGTPFSSVLAAVQRLLTRSVHQA